jgi:phosphatidate cytidylyltransferase
LTATARVTRPSERGGGARRFGDSSRGLEDLAPRILSALVLIPAGLGAAHFGGPWLAAACGAAVAAMSFEWARMSAPDRLWPQFGWTLAGGLSGVAAASWGAVSLGLGAIAAIAAIAAIWAGPGRKRADAAFGVVYVGLPVSAFLWLREPDIGGAALIFGLFAIVWAADAAAYFGGRLIGGPKLHPGISPNKTWAGVAAGVVAGALAGAAVGAAVGAGPSVWALAGAVLGFVSMLGDLLESLLKRRFGVKDASGFIPGHGGVLDRLDGLMAASVALAAGVLAAPGLALALSAGWG